MRIQKLLFSTVTLITFLGLTFISESSFSKQSNIYNSFYPDKYAALVVDANTGDILQQTNANVKRYPASLTKMMTLYLTFEALRDKRLNMEETVTVSRHAASQPRMNLALRAGEKIKVVDLIRSVVVLSANDSAVVLAEKISGSENTFAAMMTKTARYLGMNNTNFSNASGLPNSKQVTTAKDMARLMVALKRDFPGYYNMLSLKSFSYKRQDFGGHNQLMKTYAGAKAGKTGYIMASGFNLALNAERNGKSLVGVVMGGRTAKTRDDYMKNILDSNFALLNGGSSAINNVAVNNAKVINKPVVTQVAQQNKIITKQAINFALNNSSRNYNNKPAPASLVQGYQSQAFQIYGK